jgi:hypothetical protein
MRITPALIANLLQLLSYSFLRLGQFDEIFIILVILIPILRNTVINSNVMRGVSRVNFILLIKLINLTGTKFNTICKFINRQALIELA